MLRFFVSNKKDSLRFEHAGGLLEFGREAKMGSPRVVLNDPYVSSSHLRVEERPGGQVQVTNLSKRLPVLLADGTEIGIDEVSTVALPARMTIGESLIEIQSGEELPIDPSSLMTVAQPVNRSSVTKPLVLDQLTGNPNPEELARWFESVITVQRAAAGSPNFYNEIARAVVELIGLDYALVMLRKGDDWDVVSRYAAPDAPRLEFSRTVLDRLIAEKRTFYQASGLTNTAQSLSGITTLVASPVLDSEGEKVLGAVYGAKVRRSALGGDELKPLHAQLVQVLAAAAGAGIARMESETEAARRLVQFEQFFSRELAEELDRNPELLAGQDREVTILVSDVRGFSRIAERFSPRETCLLMGDVLERLTTRIKDHGGVVVDYAGDGILAMWNAPVPQPDHAARACRAAIAMLGELAGLNERWAERIQTRLALGIGINTGEALVGNTGSVHRLKYGPLGNTVNLASRVEGVTKQLGVPVLITETTHEKLGGAFATRRLCQVRVVGIDTPVVLHELHGETAPPDWIAFRDAYEAALALYENGNLSGACRALFPLLDDPERGQDQPALILASRAIDGLKSTTRDFDPVIVLDSK
jgi:adenylate cyclase